MSLLNLDNKNKDILDLKPLDEKVDGKAKVVRKNERRGKSVDTYKGPLRIIANEGIELSDEAVYFSKFLNSLGQDGMTYEDLFQRIKDMNHPEITRSNVAHKLYTIKAKGKLSFTWMRNIAEVLGYEVEIKFLPKTDPESFKEEIPIEKGIYDDYMNL